MPRNGGVAMPRKAKTFSSLIIPIRLIVSDYMFSLFTVLMDIAMCSFGILSKKVQETKQRDV